VKLTNPFAVDCDFSIHVVHTLAADLDLDKLKEKEKQKAGQRHAFRPALHGSVPQLLALAFQLGTHASCAAVCGYNIACLVSQVTCVCK